MIDDDDQISRRTFLQRTMAGVAFCVMIRGATAVEALDEPSYRIAIEQGADYVEQDLQVTKDGVLVCSHDETLERMTNVAEVFPDRHTEVSVKENAAKRWHFHDFTLKEIKQLDAGAKFNAKFKGTTIPTWQEAIDEIKGKAGLCPEIKNPEVYARIGVSMEKLFYDLVKKNGLENPNGSTPILIQSFNKDSLKQLGQYGLKHPMLQLSNARAKWTAEKLDQVKGYATAIGRPRTMSRRNWCKRHTRRDCKSWPTLTTPRIWRGSSRL